MSPREQVMVDRLSALARDEAPPPLDADVARRMVREAAARGRLGGRRRARRRGVVALVAAAAVLLAAGAALWLHDEGADLVAVDQDEPLHVALPTGDRLTAAPGARFRVDSSERAERRVSLERGAMLFDVAKLGGGSSFEVVTPHLRTRVLGTVFSVETDDDRTVVRVFEGRVAVAEQAGAAGRASRRLVRAREATRSGSDAVRPLADGGPLAEEGWRAAAARGASAEQPGGDAPGTAAVERPDPAVPPAAGTAGEAEPPSPAAAVRPDPAERVPDPAAARRLVAGGDARGALEAARAHARTSRGPERARWRVVEGDALRALRRWGAAADAYERAAPELPPTEAVRAGYTAASIRFHRLGDDAGALAALERSGAFADGSPLAERALALRARALRRAGRLDEARAAARRYLERFPEGGMADWMAGVAEQPD